MRIAQVIQNLECGGSSAMAVALSLEFAQSGHQIEVVCLDRPKGSVHERLFLQALNQHGISSRFLGRKTKRAGLWATIKLWWLIQRGQFDIVHSHLSMPDAITGFIRRLTPTRFHHVLTVHSTVEPRSAIRTALAGGGNIVYCSQAARTKSRPLRNVSNAVIPNGISQSAYFNASAQRVQTRRELGLPDDALVVILVGRMCPQKHFDLAIDALKVLHERAPRPNLRYVFCGDGDERQKLEMQARRFGLSDAVQFCGSRTDISALLGASDVFLSTSRFEGMPIAVLEALSVGIPCILSSIEEHCEIAGDMPGCMFVPPDNAEEVASALEVVLEKRLPASGFRSDRAVLLEKFSIEKCAQSYLSLYKSICRV